MKAKQAPSEGQRRPAGFFARHPRLARAGVALAALGAADAALGALYRQARPSFRTAHPYYHHGLLANRAGQAQWGGGAIYPVFTNSLGFADREVREIALEPAGRRVVLLGDSFTEGIGVPFHETFAGILQQRFEPRGIEVLDAAAMSYSPRLYYLKTRYLLEEVGLEFDELFVFLDISDVQDEILYRKFEPRLPSAFERLGERARRFALDTSFLARSADELLSRERLRKRREGYDTKYYPPWLDYFWSDNQDEEPYSDARFLAVRSDWTTPQMLGNAWTQEGLQRAKEHMDALVELCSAHAIELTLAVYPWPPQVERREDPSPQVVIWSAFCRERGLEFVDLFPAFRPAPGAAPAAVLAQYFIPGDVHWNPAGHRRVAELVEPYVED